MKISVSKQEFNAFVNNLMEKSDFEVIGVKEKGGKFVYSDLENASELRLDHDITILPPKKYFLPQYETLMHFDLSRDFHVEEHEEDAKRVIIGVHPYDIVAIQQMDEVYLSSHADRMYRKRRENTVIIGVDIVNVSEYSFASSLGTHVVTTGYDLMLTDIGERIVIDIATEKGRELIEKYLSNYREASQDEIEAVNKLREALPNKYKRKLSIEEDQLPFLFSDVYYHPLWEEKAEKCFQCGSCTLVCPTCFCYDVKDEIHLTGKRGRRIRTWDGCLLPEFTKIASGEVFRKEKSERFRHRFYRKALYIPYRFNFIACVGCGRCVVACITKVADPVDVINELVERKNESKGRLRFKIPEGIESDEDFTHIPKPATIVRIEQLTENEKLFEIRLDNA
ncbi:MAG TPA: hypothetical protein ENG74_03840, partial [Thermoplasmatales archaeon]|nr:hypothetical protein [Thermoplasmatales archaeon]